MKEFVFFLFLQNEKILIEHRLPESEEPGKLFIPCGGIEERDRSDEEDYRIAAMKREIREEFGETIHISEFTFLTTVEKAETMAMYYSYVIQKWEGTIPEYSMEQGVQNAKLQWTPIDEAFLEIDSDVARMTIGKALAVLRDGSLNS